VETKNTLEGEEQGAELEMELVFEELVLSPGVVVAKKGLFYFHND
jgi:hypothetical protein